MKKLRIPLLFAFRYLFSKKSVNAINIISIISIVGVFVSTAALVIVLSFYNGMEKFILSMYSNFAPELRIEAKQGKTFDTTHAFFQELKNNPAVRAYSPLLEDKILIQYEGQQIVGKLRGIEPEILQQQDSESILHAGDLSIQVDSTYSTLIGAQIQANLRVPISNYHNTIDLYFPRKEIAISNANPLEDFNIRSIQVSGILTYEPEFDNLMLVPIDFARDIIGESTKISALEIFLHDKEQIADIQQVAQKKIGDNFLIKNREEQNPTLYKTIKSEKWIVFFILTFIGIIAIFNIIGSLTMLVIDKKDDMKILQNLGAEKSTIEKIFFIEGILISIIGSVLGIIFGFAFCKLQEIYGFIRTGSMEGSMIDVYPIDIRLYDFILVFATVFILSYIVSYFASKLSVREIGKLATDTSTN